MSAVLPASGDPLSSSEPGSQERWRRRTSVKDAVLPPSIHSTEICSLSFERLSTDKQCLTPIFFQKKTIYAFRVGDNCTLNGSYVSEPWMTFVITRVKNIYTLVRNQQCVHPAKCESSRSLPRISRQMRSKDRCARRRWSQRRVKLWFSLLITDQTKNDRRRSRRGWCIDLHFRLRRAVMSLLPIEVMRLILASCSDMSLYPSFTFNRAIVWCFR